MTSPKREFQTRREFVVGRSEEEFRWFLSSADGERTDDDLTMARRFAPLDVAIEVSTKAQGNVFEVMGKPGKPRIRELMVDLDKAANVPFLGCYRLGKLFVAGPTMSPGALPALFTGSKRCSKRK